MEERGPWQDRRSTSFPFIPLKSHMITPPCKGISAMSTPGDFHIQLYVAESCHLNTWLQSPCHLGSHLFLLSMPWLFQFLFFSMGAKNVVHLENHVTLKPDDMFEITRTKIVVQPVYKMFWLCCLLTWGAKHSTDSFLLSTQLMSVLFPLRLDRQGRQTLMFCCHGSSLA